MSSQQPGGGVGGGGIAGLNQFANGDTESVWIAVFIFFILWLIGLLILPIVEATAGDPKPSESGVPRTIHSYTRAARDGFLILLATTLANQAGHGITYNIVAITWTSFALLVLWTLLHTFTPLALRFMWWIEMLVFLPIAALQIANFALAFRNAPSMR
ncbi:hypothetical protein HK105_207364 [Polyrhizophydium stewartii]|uniref:Uncharacterized protein n=1 Tax=Polyrhizophydium stewartii TaxID=2732419 RepID=A0ABR4N0Z5_9FUNG